MKVTYSNLSSSELKSGDMQALNKCAFLFLALSFKKLLIPGSTKRPVHPSSRSKYNVFEKSSPSRAPASKKIPFFYKNRIRIFGNMDNFFQNISFDYQ